MPAVAERATVPLLVLSITGQRQHCVPPSTTQTSVADDVHMPTRGFDLQHCVVGLMQRLPHGTCPVVGQAASSGGSGCKPLGQRCLDIQTSTLMRKKAAARKKAF